MVLIEVNGEQMEQCDNCGRIWDGNAQCNCWVDMFGDLNDHEYNVYHIPINYDTDDESGYESG